MRGAWFSHKADVLLAVQTVSSSLSGVCCGIIIVLVSSRKGTSQRSVPQCERDTDDTPRTSAERNTLRRSLFWSCVVFEPGRLMSSGSNDLYSANEAVFLLRWLIDLIISAKVHRALNKYPGAIAATLTEVNEIYGGKTQTGLDFSTLWHFQSAQRWRRRNWGGGRM